MFHSCDSRVQERSNNSREQLYIVVDDSFSVGSKIIRRLVSRIGEEIDRSIESSVPAFLPCRNASFRFQRSAFFHARSWKRSFSLFSIPLTDISVYDHNFPRKGERKNETKGEKWIFHPKKCDGEKRGWKEPGRARRSC